MIDNFKKIAFIIGRSNLNKIMILILLLLIGMFFEILGLGILLPVLTVIANPEKLNNIPYLKDLALFNTLTYNYIVLYLLTTILIIYSIKTFFLSYLTFRQNRFLSNISAITSNKLFEKYLIQSFSFHVNNNSSKLVKNLTTEINLFGAYNFAAISIFVELGLLISILGTLILIEPIGAISVGLFLGILVLIFYKLTRLKLSKWGLERTKVDEKIAKVTYEGLTGIREVKLFTSEKYFLKQLEINNLKKSYLNSNANTISQLPRFFLELISVLGLVIFIIVMLYRGSDIPTLIATIGVFVAAVFRLMPSLNKILTSFQNIKFYAPSVEIIYHELKLAEKKNLQHDKNYLSLKESLCLDSVSFKYEGSSSFILRDISLEIIKGQMIGIIGKSGSGKTSLINIINGLFEPSEGKFLIDGKEINNSLFSLKSIIGYVPQDIFLMDDSIKNNIAFGIDEKNIDSKKLDLSIKMAELDKFIKSLKDGIESKVGERGVQVSGGQKQRIGLARALYNDPDILLLDEATSALDSKTESAIMSSINNLKTKKTIIIVAHRESTLSNCDRIFEMNNKKLIEK